MENRSSYSIPWIMFSNVRIPNFEQTKVAKNASSFHIYGINGSSSEASVFGDKLSIFNLDTGHLESSREDHLELVSSFVEVDFCQIRLMISNQNITPVYLWRDRNTERFIFGTDLPTVIAAVSNITGNPISLLDVDNITLDSLSSAKQIERVKHCTEIKFWRETASWKFTRTCFEDPICKYRADIFQPLEAGEAQIKVLRSVIDEHTTGKQSIGALISGGVDSGLVASLLARSGKPFTAYTVGTIWGDEFSEAVEMAVSAGIPVRKITLSSDEILAALPATVRAFGHGNPEVISIGVTITAFCQTINKPMLLLTGYGSDLINSGMATEISKCNDIEEDVRRAVHRTRFTSEFTATAARSYSCQLVHPYWDERVISIALRTDASAKYAFGREKGHLRVAAERYLPDEVAWRKKVAIHHGNGVKANLEALIDSHTGVKNSARKVYQSILMEQVKMAITDPQIQVLGFDLYKRAVANVASAHQKAKIA